MEKEKIVISSDHAGFRLKDDLKRYLQKRGFEVLDEGAESDKSVDYPDLVAKAASLVSRGKTRRGIVLCGTGIGASITANKFPGVRAALVYEPEMARLSREHNDSNMLVLSGRFTPPAKARKILATWLSVPFSGEARHKRRILKIRGLEKKLLGLILMLLSCLPAFLPGRTFTWEGKDLSSLLLDSCVYEPAADADRIVLGYDRPDAEGAELCLDFDSDNPVSDLTGRYRISQYVLFRSRETSFRNTPAAGFSRKGDRVVLVPPADSWFNEQTDLESFSLSFWLRPRYATGRRNILERGAFVQSRYYGIRVFLQDEHLVFRFENMWIDPKGRAFTLELQPRSAVRLDVWASYCASYDNTSGKLVLFVNGQEDDIVWATTDRRPESTLLVPRFKGRSDIVLGGEPAGDVDDLSVTRSFQVEPLHMTVRAADRGEVRTPVLENPLFNTEILRVLLNRNPSLAGCSVWYRGSSEAFDASAVKPDWEPFAASRQAKFFQVKVDLESDGTRRDSPFLKSLAVETRDAMAVEPPTEITLGVTNDLLRVSWVRLFDRRIRGYFVAVMDASGPVARIDAGDASEILVPDLKDRQDYTVVLSAYDDSFPPNESRPSRERKIFFTFRSPGNE